MSEWQSKYWVVLGVLLLISACETATLRENDVSGPLWSLTDDPLLAIGRVDGDEAYLLSRVRDVRLLQKSGVLVADGATQTLRLYDSLGFFERQFGGRGDGPGEFRSFTYVGVAGPDTIIVNDPTAYRLTFYSTTGQLISTKQLVTSDGALPSLYLGAYANGDHAVAWISHEERDPSVITPDRMQVGRFSREGTLLEVVASMDGMRRRGSPLPFSPHFLAGMFEDSLFLTNGIDGTVLVLGPAGDSARVIEVVAETLDFDSAWTRLESAIADTSRLTQAREMRPHAQQEPVPVFSDLLIDDGGQLWIKLYDPLTDSHQLGRPRIGGTWLILNRTGHHIAQVSMPDGFRPVHVHGRRIAGITQDHLGVERVVVYGIEP